VPLGRAASGRVRFSGYIILTGLSRHSVHVSNASLLKEVVLPYGPAQLSFLSFGKPAEPKVWWDLPSVHAALSSAPRFFTRPTGILVLVYCFRSVVHKAVGALSC